MYTQTQVTLGIVASMMLGLECVNNRGLRLARINKRPSVRLQSQAQGNRQTLGQRRSTDPMRNLRADLLSLERAPI